VKANPGDILQFQFSQINHTVTQSTFTEPCQPIQASDPTAAGIHSGFVPVMAGAATVMTFDVPVNDTKPMFIYCAQGPHCQLGMVMTVNELRPSPTSLHSHSYK
jgi:plastocyanin